MKDEGSTTLKLKDISLLTSAAAHHESTATAIKVTNQLTFNIECTVVENAVTKKQAKASKSDSIFRYNIAFKDGHLDVSDVEFDLGSQPFHVNISVPSGV